MLRRKNQQRSHALGSLFHRRLHFELLEERLALSGYTLAQLPFAAEEAGRTIRQPPVLDHNGAVWTPVGYTKLLRKTPDGYSFYPIPENVAIYHVIASPNGRVAWLQHEVDQAHEIVTMTWYFNGSKLIESRLPFDSPVGFDSPFVPLDGLQGVYSISDGGSITAHDYNNLANPVHNSFGVEVFYQNILGGPEGFYVRTLDGRVETIADTTIGYTAFGVIKVMAVNDHGDVAFVAKKGSGNPYALWVKMSNDTEPQIVAPVFDNWRLDYGFSKYGGFSNAGQLTFWGLSSYNPGMWRADPIPETDLAISSLIIEAGQVKYSLDVAGSTLTRNTGVSFFWSRDDIYDSSDVLALDVPITGGDRNVGSHLKSLAIDALTSAVVPPAGTTHLIVVADSKNFVFELDESNNVKAVPYQQSDIEVLTPTWNSQIGGIDFRYKVTGGAIPANTNTTVKAYWANGAGLNNRISPEAPVYTLDIDTADEKTEGTHGPFNVPGSILRNAPPGTTHILFVADSENALPLHPPSVAALKDVTIQGDGSLSATTRTVIKDNLRYAGQSYAIATSTVRTIEDQARIMFDNMFKPLPAEALKKHYTSPIRFYRDLYDANGDAVIDVLIAYCTLNATGDKIIAVNATRDLIIQEMVDKIREIKKTTPTAFSHTNNDPTLQVVDLATRKKVGDREVDIFVNARLFEQAISGDSRIQRHFSPFTRNLDPVFHLEISQPSPNPPATGQSNDLASGSSSLMPSIPLYASRRFGIAAGAVGEGEQVFAFDANAGDEISFGVLVTQVLPGSMYTDDDTVLYLFDDSGELLASNDDTDPFESEFEALISNFVVSSSGTYYAAVTTYGNSPILDANNVVTGWENDGGSAVEFDLFVFFAWDELAGDYNFDGNVDAADYVVWRNSLGSSTNLEADGNGDGVVGPEDYNIWRTDVGKSIPPIRTSLPGDFNFDAVVDTSDYIVWRDTLGSMVTAYSGADGDGNGIVGPEDYQIWRANYGASFSRLLTPLPGDFTQDGAVDNADYVVWRNSIGESVPAYSGADGNGNGIIDAADYDLWRSNFGTTFGASALASNVDSAAMADSAMLVSDEPLLYEISYATSMPNATKGTPDVAFAAALQLGDSDPYQLQSAPTSRTVEKLIGDEVRRPSLLLTLASGTEDGYCSPDDNRPFGVTKDLSIDWLEDDVLGDLAGIRQRSLDIVFSTTVTFVEL